MRGPSVLCFESSCCFRPQVLGAAREARCRGPRHLCARQLCPTVLIWELQVVEHVFSHMATFGGHWALEF